MTLVLKGVAVSTGIVRGTAHVLAADPQMAAPRRPIEESEVPEELSRFRAALVEAATDLVGLQRSVQDRIGTAAAEIFNAQVLALKDPLLMEQVEGVVRSRKVNVESALAEVIEGFSRTLAEAAAVYMRERAADVRDVGRRILSVLIRRQRVDGQPVPAGSIVVAEELLPSATARMDLQRVRGFVTERGGKTSHACILARSLGIPAVTGVKEATARIRAGDELIVDAMAGTVFVNPAESIRHEYERLEADIRAYQDSLKGLVDLPAETRDGVRVTLMSNLGKLADAEAALLFNADGVGLYRTEFGYLIQSEFPSEEEQARVAMVVAEKFHPRPVTFRILDLGGDKQLSYFPLPPSRNPALAERGIRLMLKHRAVLDAQVRSLLRASAAHPVRLLLPMVGGLEEVREAKKVIAECKAQLRQAGASYNDRMPVGAMIEVPSSVVLVSQLAKELDFFSLGTNDLVQYLLVADREEQSLDPYYEPLHPAVLHTIRHLTTALDAAGKEFSICGEMAGNPFYTELLLGLGLRSFSVAPGELLEVKGVVRSLRMADARALADEVLGLDSVAAIEERLQRARPSSLPPNTVSPDALRATP
jgi:phosphotransferase system enzyme I (PtsI)